jgi:phosphate transport system substrate-binding protein
MINKRHIISVDSRYRLSAIPLTLLALFLSVALACNKNKDAGQADVEETLTSGKLTLYTDNTVQPIIEDVLAVFHNVYGRAAIAQVNSTENEIVRALLTDSAAVVVLPRLLTKEEEAFFKRKNILPRITHFATDAIALVGNNKATDTIVELEEVIKILRGETSSKIKSIVFDNPNSSTVQYLLKMANVKAVSTANVFSLKSNEEVIKYVHDNNGAVGIIGVNWLLQPPQDLKKYADNITVLAVDNVKFKDGDKKYYKPTQSNIATGAYPLTRKLYLLNYQGRQGLGMGFATYLSAREGQRIILKSGLLPTEIPTREVDVQTD